MSTQTQQTTLLFKHYNGVGNSNPKREYYEEIVKVPFSIDPTPLWSEVSRIPNTPPGGMTNALIAGVVQYYLNLTLNPLDADGYSFQHANLINAIPQNYGTIGGYNMALETSSSVPIPYGTWEVDSLSGILTFYSAAPPSGVSFGAPPKLTFYKYVGSQGLARKLLTVNKSAHGFAAGQILSTSGGVYQLASSTDTTVVGIVDSVQDVNNFILLTEGTRSDSSGFAAGDTVYVSGTSPGAYTNSSPTAGNRIGITIIVAGATYIQFHRASLQSTSNIANALVLRDGSGTFAGSLTGAASLNVLKAGDTMTGVLNASIAGIDAASSALNLAVSTATSYQLGHSGIGTSSIYGVGTAGQVIFNNGGKLGSSSNLTYDGTNLSSISYQISGANALEFASSGTSVLVGTTGASITGANNTILGNTAALNLASGTDNVVIGMGALKGSASSVLQTVAIGSNALSSLTSGGNNNVVIGYSAGTNVTSAGLSILLGSNAKHPDGTTNGAFVVSNSSSTSYLIGNMTNYRLSLFASSGTTDPLTYASNIGTHVLGLTSGTSPTTVTGGIGLFTDGTSLKVVNSAGITTLGTGGSSAGASGDVQYSNGSGGFLNTTGFNFSSPNLTIPSAGSYQIGGSNVLTAKLSNTLIGLGAGTSLTTGSSNIIIGNNAGSDTTTLPISASNFLIIANASKSALMYGNMSTNSVGFNYTSTDIASIAPVLAFTVSIAGSAAQSIGVERNPTSNSAGNNLTISAGGATVGASSLNGGNLILQTGISTGNQSNGSSVGSIILQVADASQSTSTADNVMAVRDIIPPCRTFPGIFTSGSVIQLATISLTSSLRGTQGTAFITVEVNNGTDIQTTCTMAQFVLSNKAGAVSSNIVTIGTNATSASSGTLTLATTISFSVATTAHVNITPTSSLGGTLTAYLHCRITLNQGAAATITAP